MLKNILLIAGCFVCTHIYGGETLIPKAHKMIVEPSQAFFEANASQNLVEGDLVQYKKRKLLTNIDVNKSKTVFTVKTGGLYQIFSSMQGTSTPGATITMNISVNGKTKRTVFSSTSIAFLDGSFFIFPGGPTYLEEGDKVSVALVSATAPITLTKRYFVLINSNNT